MKTYFNQSIAALCVAASMSVLSACAPAKSDEPTSEQWDFDSSNGWVDASQNMDGKINYIFQEGHVFINARANTWDRPKIRTKSFSYGLGKYTWSVYVPKMGVGDMASVGAFLYNDDRHELDFEIGYGTAVVREQLQAGPNDLIAYTTSQALPFVSTPRKITRKRWYTLSIELRPYRAGKYEAIWSIDDVIVNQVNLQYGPEYTFGIFCSVENLKFIGDHIPAQDNYALFDYVSFAAP